MSKVLALITSFFLILSINSFPQNYGGWTSVTPMNVPRQYHASIKLPNGNILVTGGMNNNGTILDSCEIYNYKTKTWTFAANMKFARGEHHIILLDSNRVMVIGGYDEKSCEIYYINENKWEIIDSLKVTRNYGWTSTLLNNGKILVTGGFKYSSDLKNLLYINDVEIFNPTSNSWTEIDTLKIGRSGHTATLLNNGKVLIVGGEINEKELKDCELFDPTTEKWSSVDSLNTARYNSSEILLSNGNVLVSGGTNYSNAPEPWLSSCEIYNPSTNIWSVVTSMEITRDKHSSIILNNGYILFIGGDVGNSTWELYDPISFKNIYSGNYPTLQSNQQIELLNNGNVISIGGLTWTNTDLPVLSSTAMCEMYSPSIDAIDDKTNNPIKTFELSQNYPNPFNPSTNIKYNLNKSGHVTLIVYNIFGEVVKKLVESYKNQGSYSVKFDGTNLCSGVYFYTLSINGNEVTKKMILLR